MDNPKMQRFLETIKKPNVYVPSIALIVLLAVGASIFNQYRLAGKKEGGETTKAGFSFLGGSNTVTEKRIASSLDGVDYPEADANRHALGVIIENHVDSRPQAGLADAAVVYEALAEGGITRFLAIFGPKVPEKVGPIRSARTYFLDWCLEYDCFFAHVGGNIDALDLIPKIGIKDLDQFRYGVSKYGKTYYREPRAGIATEHTMFGDPSKLYEIAKTNKWPETGSHPAVTFKSDADEEDRPAGQTVDIEISSKNFNTSWRYNPATNKYDRSMGGTIHKDGGTGARISSSVVIVQEVAAKPTVTRINEQGLTMTTIGSGKAKIIQDGTMIEGTWKKSSQKERTVFYDDEGKEVRFNRGQRWITVVTPGTKVTSTITAATPSPAQ